MHARTCTHPHTRYCKKERKKENILLLHLTPPENLVSSTLPTPSVPGAAPESHTLPQARTLNLANHSGPFRLGLSSLVNGKSPRRNRWGYALTKKREEEKEEKGKEEEEQEEEELHSGHLNGDTIAKQQWRGRARIQSFGFWPLRFNELQTLVE